MQIANNYNEFIEKIVNALMKRFNTDEGQRAIEELLKAKARQNPNLTPEEWQKTKEQFLVFCFFQFIKNVPEAEQEFSGHLWRELQKA